MVTAVIFFGSMVLAIVSIFIASRKKKANK